MLRLKNKSAVKTRLAVGEARTIVGRRPTGNRLGSVRKRQNGILLNKHLSAIVADNALRQAVAFAGGGSLFKNYLPLVNALSRIAASVASAGVANRAERTPEIVGAERNLHPENKYLAALGANHLVRPARAGAGGFPSLNRYGDVGNFRQLCLLE